MTLRTMRASFLFLGVSGAVLMHGPSAAWAQRAEPLPYSDDERDRARNEEDARDESMERPSRPQRREREETDPNEAREREYGVGERRRTYFREDDPHLGLGAELLGGLMLLDRSSGSADAELGYGL
ncbi:MAG TPA: hypothetical protein VEY30_08400, partial [Myxococcaceae bacterium]|nr:hypothetical protein [Myxococcaceae bacterium]